MTGDGTGSAPYAEDTTEYAKQRAKTFAEGFAAAASDLLDITAFVASEEAEGIILGFEGPDAHLLVGRAGRTLDALQYIASNVVNRRTSRGRLHVIFDADSYRARRETTLNKLAADLAAQVVSTGEEAVLDPLSPLERRIVHNALKDIPGVRTYSEGEEPERYIIISPAA
ncbi:MAG: R3H domain-containing nucleic acid-binding protein [Armatimonadota bacterium]